MLKAFVLVQYSYLFMSKFCCKQAIEMMSLMATDKESLKTGNLFFKGEKAYKYVEVNDTLLCFLCYFSYLSN